MNAGMNVLFVRLARFGCVLALAVVMLGAWVRLHDAGLGCPDWPGCYGKLVVPDSATAAQDPGFAARPLVAAKAWREMIHRYLAGTLVLVCVALGAQRLEVGRVYVADPRGYLIVSYPAEVEQKELLRDLKRLLSASGSN